MVLLTRMNRRRLSWLCHCHLLSIHQLLLFHSRHHLMICNRKLELNPNSNKQTIISFFFVSGFGWCFCLLLGLWLLICLLFRLFLWLILLLFRKQTALLNKPAFGFISVSEQRRHEENVYNNFPRQ